MKMILEIEGLTHSRNGVPVLGNIDLKVAKGETVAIVGPSGAGKSTILDIIFGTITPDQGGIFVNNETVVEPSRSRGIVYQQYTLRPFETVEKNAAVGPWIENTSLPRRFFHAFRDVPIKILRSLGYDFGWKTLDDPYIEAGHRWLEKVGMMHAAKRYPGQLSGGMQQRVAIAQSLIMEPEILLMDEPFGALDGKTRGDCQRMMLDLQIENMESVKRGEQPRYTVILVTHDIFEAIKIADRVVAISQYHPLGKQGATIVYDRPTPNFDPKNPVGFDFPKAVAMEDEIRQAAMNPENLEDKSQFVTFWDDVRAGRVQGVCGEFRH